MLHSLFTSGTSICQFGENSGEEHSMLSSLTKITVVRVFVLILQGTDLH